MVRFYLRALLALAVISLVNMAQVAFAAECGEHPDQLHSTCWASGSLTESLADVARADDRWDCKGSRYRLDGERIFFRYDVAGHPPARYFATRRSAVQAIHILVIDRDGEQHETSLPKSQWLNSVREGHVRVPIRGASADSETIIVAFDRATHSMLLDGAYLTTAEEPEQTGYLLFLAALCGMLTIPLVFNVAFYRVLREDFVIWHGVMVVSLIGTVVVSSALASWVLPFEVMTLSVTATLLLGLTLASGTMFTYGFIEPGRMHPWLRRALPWCAISAVTISILHAAFPYVWRPVQSAIFTALHGPILLIFILALVDAVRRGSRAVLYQIVGWAPMLAVCIIRLVTGVVPSMAADDAMPLFYIGCVFEVTCTAMGVADRFMSLKHQRDSARTEAEVLERIAERDVLTGLLNRRAFEKRIDALFAAGFNALAVLDLDHFKAINDSYGHGVGDLALKATAEALRPNARVEVFRMGGEEFVMLLRGKDAHIQAERRRQAIHAVVSDMYPDIKRRVTASMGVVEMVPDAAGKLDVHLCFEAADKLLYEAKQEGRDRAKFGRVESQPVADSPQWDGQGASGEGSADRRLMTQLVPLAPPPQNRLEDA